MSINNNEENINRRKYRNDFSIFRDNFFINRCRNENSNNDKKINENSFVSLEPLLFNKRLNEQNNNNRRNMINSRSMVNIKPIFNKKKNDNFNNNFKPKPNIEEIPTFSFENDLNVKSFRIFMNRKNEILEKNLENFRRYMINHENKQKKNTLINPYSLYIKKINDVNNYEKSILPKIQQREMENKRLKLNKYEKQNNIINKINQSSFSTTNKNTKSFDLKFYLEEVEKNRKERGINKEIEIEKENIRKEREINKEIEKENNIEKVINVSNSIDNMINTKKYFPKNNEISNPELFYKKNDIEFYKYRNEQKKLGDYNYKLVLIHNKNRFIKKEPDINPFNQKINLFKVSDSSLSHNIILRPGESYGNFKCN